MGTIGYVRNNEETLSHLNWKNVFRTQKWKMKRNGIKIRASYRLHLQDLINQIVKEELVLEIVENENKKYLKEEHLRKLIFPQEFMLILERCKKFEFLGFFEHDHSSIRKLKRHTNFNYLILRRV